MGLCIGSAEKIAKTKSRVGDAAAMSRYFVSSTSATEAACMYVCMYVCMYESVTVATHAIKCFII